MYIVGIDIAKRKHEAAVIDGEGAVIMMGAILNIGAVVGKRTMIDMGAVLGGRATEQPDQRQAHGQGEDEQAGENGVGKQACHSKISIRGRS